MLFLLLQTVSLLSVFLVFPVCLEAQEPIVIKLGVIYEDGPISSDVIERSLRDVKQELEMVHPGLFELQLIESKLTNDNPLQGIHQACSFINKGISAIISSVSCHTNTAIQQLSKAYLIPNLMIPVNRCAVKKDFSVNIMANINRLNEIFINIMESQNLNTVTLLYDVEYAGCNRGALIQDLLPVNVSMYELTATTPEARLNDIARLLESLKVLHVDYNFIVVASNSTVITILEEAKRLNMLSADYTWILYSSNLNKPDIFAGNSTAAIILPNQETIDYERTQPGDSLQTELYNADMYYAIQLWAKAVTETFLLNKWPVEEDFTCESYNNTGDRWLSGQRLRDKIIQLYNYELSEFETRYFTESNIDLGLEVLSYRRRGMWKIVYSWTIAMTMSLPGDVFKVFNPLHNGTLLITTVIEYPFVTEKITPNGSQYRGFCVDLLDKMAEEFQFTYRLKIADTYGQPQKDGSWNGMIAKLVNREVDMAVAGMTIIASREKVVDFSVRYMDYGVGIIMSKRGEEMPSTLKFLQPFHWKVWICVLCATMASGIILFCITRVTPYAKSGTNPAQSEYYYFTPLNSIWFTWSSLVQQGGDYVPKAVSTRILGAFWWFFSLIMVATYTANLAAFLTINRMEGTIDDLVSLVGQREIHYGTIANSSVQSAFTDQADANEVYRQIDRYFNQMGDKVLMASTDEAYLKVSESNYAFMWDYPILQQKAATDCSMQTVGQPFLPKGYGIALQRGAPYREDINKFILNQGELGYIDDLKKKWFQTEDISCGKTSIDGSESSQEKKGIDFHNVSGIFYILIGGLLMSFSVSVIEVFWYRRKQKTPAAPECVPHNVSSPQLNMKWSKIPEKFVPAPKQHEAVKSETIYKKHEMTEMVVQRYAPVYPSYPYDMSPCMRPLPSREATV